MAVAQPARQRNRNTNVKPNQDKYLSVIRKEEMESLMLEKNVMMQMLLMVMDVALVLRLKKDINV